MSDLLLAISIGATVITGARALGGDIASLNTPFYSNLNHTHRQDVCHRFNQFRHGSIQLRDALSGLQIHPLMAKGDWLEYDDITGLSEEDPGLLAELMDALAERANFTWRQSFAVVEPPEVLNKSWTEMLLWGVEHYDINVNGWDLTVERMEKGASYIEPWFDGSIILIDQKDPPEDVNSIIWFNWMFPFETAVWVLTGFTILISALVYQFIEYMHDEREDRPPFQWFSDNLYLSCLNISQNFEYAPNSVAGRIFSTSSAFFALIMTATYTANLASLFVQEGKPALVVDSIDQAVALEIPICTWGNTNSDEFLAKRWPKAKRVPFATELEGYQALRRGECGLVAAYKDNWLNHKLMGDYNPECDLDWVGRIVEPIRAGFAVKTDLGHLCTSLIRDVLNVHMMELMGDGTLLQIYTKHRLKLQDMDCDATATTDYSSRRLGAQKPQQQIERRRKLKGGGKGAAAAGGANGSSTSAKLTLQQMLGTFAFHWVAMVVAVIVCVATTYFDKWGWNPQKTVFVRNRQHGPIIGSPPKANTRVALARNYGGTGTKRLDLNYDMQCTSEVDRLRLKQPPKRLHSIATTLMTGSLGQDGEDTTSESRHNNTDDENFELFYDCAPVASQSSPPPTQWHRSNTELHQRQERLSLQVQDLSAQMTRLISVVQEMREEQLEQKKLLISNQCLEGKA